MIEVFKEMDNDIIDILYFGFPSAYCVFLQDVYCAYIIYSCKRYLEYYRIYRIVAYNNSSIPPIPIATECNLDVGIPENSNVLAPNNVVIHDFSNKPTQNEKTEAKPELNK